MGIMDSDALTKCIASFSNEIKKISEEICEEISSGKKKFDEVTYNKFSDAYNKSFSNYITNKDKKRFSHTNDVLKGLSKKIKKFGNKPISILTYREYCNCYRNCYKRNKRGTAAINYVSSEYSEMVETLTEKLKEIVEKSKARLDIKISDDGFNEKSKQKKLFKKFKEFDNFLESIHLNGKYSQISDEFKKSFSDYINGKGLDEKRKWFSHTNDVFKAIDKKLKKFDAQFIDEIDEETYNKYSECFKYDPKKLSKKAAIDNKSLFDSYQKLHKKILIKLEDHLEDVSLKGFKNAINNFGKDVDSNINNICRCSDFDKYLKKYFSNIYYDKKNEESIYSLFEDFVNFKYYFFGSKVEPDFYTDKISHTAFYSDYSNKKSKLYDKLIKLIGTKIEERVKNIEDGLDRKVELTIDSGDISFNNLSRVLTKSHPKDVSFVMKLAVMTDLTLKVSENFSIGTSSYGTLGGVRKISNTKEIVITPNLETIKIEGTNKVTLTEIDEKLFQGISNLKSIEFKNVGFDKDIDLTELKESLGVAPSVVVRIDNKTLDVFIEEEEDKKKNQE